MPAREVRAITASLRHSTGSLVPPFARKYVDRQHDARLLDEFARQCGAHVLRGLLGAERGEEAEAAEVDPERGSLLQLPHPPRGGEQRTVATEHHAELGDARRERSRALHLDLDDMAERRQFLRETPGERLRA